jgi:hypothetical protein
VAPFLRIFDFAWVSTEPGQLQVASFSLGASPPLKVQVLRDRLIVTTEDSRRYEVLRDLVVGTLSILRHTPTDRLGINLDAHIPTGSEKAWHAIGDRLAPKGPWKGVLESPGMLMAPLEN